MHLKMISSAKLRAFLQREPAEAFNSLLYFGHFYLTELFFLNQLTWFGTNLKKKIHTKCIVKCMVLALSLRSQGYACETQATHPRQFFRSIPNPLMRHHISYGDFIFGTRNWIYLQLGLGSTILDGFRCYQPTMGHCDIIFFCFTITDTSLNQLSCHDEMHTPLPYNTENRKTYTPSRSADSDSPLHPASCQSWSGMASSGTLDSANLLIRWIVHGG